MRSVGFFLLGFLLLSWGRCVLADDTQLKAREAFEQGVEHYQSERFSEALNAFLNADKFSPNWKLAYNIGQCQVMLKHYGMALDTFERYLAQGGDEIAKERQGEIIAEMTRLKKLVGNLEITAPEGAQVVIDNIMRGTMPLPGKLRIAAGIEHQLRITKNEEVLADRTILVGGEEILSVGVEAHPKQQPVSLEKKKNTKILPLLTWVGVGVTVVLTGSGIGFAAAGNSRFKDFEKRNEMVEANEIPANDGGLLDAKDDTKRYDSAATGMFVGAGIFGAATVVMAIVHFAGKDEERVISATPTGFSLKF